MIRIRIVQLPQLSSIDGIRLDRFEVGREYLVGTIIASVLLAEGWAELVPLEQPPKPPNRFRRATDRPDPPNLIRDGSAQRLRGFALASDFLRRKRRRARAAKKGR